jgi:hypothetical protein
MPKKLPIFIAKLSKIITSVVELNFEKKNLICSLSAKL